MITHNISINKNALMRILSNTKSIEGRIKRGLFSRIKKGDRIKFYHDKNQCLTKITNIVEYKNILEYLSNENLDKINSCKNKSEILDIYKKFYPNILKEDRNFLAIRFEIIE